jgi:hypothetical protein
MKSGASYEGPEETSIVLAVSDLEKVACIQ